MKNNTILELSNILKVYPNGVVANRNVNMEIKKGEIHALIGENGAGKSTLMKILFGIETPEEGTILLRGEEVHIDSSRKAIDLGIGMVHQHFMLVDSLSIAENIVLGSEPTKFGLLLEQGKMHRIAQDVAAKYHFDIDVKQKVEDVSVGIKQETEILKALVRGAEILILDEPTAVLTPQETLVLFKELKALKEQGHTIIFISHKLHEIMEICDRVTIMRHGTTVCTLNISETSPQEISNLMVGRDVVLEITKPDKTPGDVVLRTDKLNYTNKLGKRMLQDVSLELREGQILSVAGVEGNGQAELAAILAGLLTPLSGDVYIRDHKIEDWSPRNFRKHHITYIPEDRMTVGCAPSLSIAENLIADKINRYLKNNFLLDEQKIRKESEEAIENFNIVCTSSEQHVDMLSGGNIQKVVAARELTDDVKIVIAEQPTRGIDAGASELIRNKLVQLREQNVAVLLISADLNEILELSDACIVLYNGRINAYFEDTRNLTEEELGYYMLGVKSQVVEKGA